MHALVASVLLRLAGFDALDADPQPQLPHRQLAQAEESAATGKGDAVVGADHPGQAEVLSNTVNA
jgi:hypothetical protein